ncbi:GNAT family N-acetyltransferase (plasmid) [Sutcliffiella horikoshii]|uniref:GNAT family N-acetyltransferase n=1 Tax=Sutcliffiella horikoshii TaxID=79883 RepID=UPI001CBD4E34|nr:GNAT family N-acetyltransferase [Sutcliffiella horikoshii]UAL49788.1 GNAT family N-acetyltransferase [Sutcliffiella horikoshii]
MITINHLKDTSTLSCFLGQEYLKHYTGNKKFYIQLLDNKLIGFFSTVVRDRTELWIEDINIISREHNELAIDSIYKYAVNNSTDFSAIYLLSVENVELLKKYKKVKYFYNSFYLCKALNCKKIRKSEEFLKLNNSLKEKLSILMKDSYDLEKNKSFDMKKVTKQIDSIFSNKQGHLLQDSSFVILDQKKDKIIAASIITLRDGRPFLLHLMVHPEYQRIGLGRKVLEHSSNSLHENRYKTLELYVYEKNTKALDLYYKNEFKNYIAGSIGTFRLTN